MSIQRKTYISVMAFVAMITFSTNVLADDQDERIKEMGFISISDSESSSGSDLDLQESELEDFPVKRVPEPKVINIPRKTNNPYVKKDRRPAPQIVKNDESEVFSGFVEVDEPIYVNGDGVYVEEGSSMAVEVDTIEVALTDKEVLTAADDIFNEDIVDEVFDEQVVVEEELYDTEDLSIQVVPQEHLEDAHNYTHYTNEDRRFVADPIGAPREVNALTLRELENKYDPPKPEVEFEYKSLDKQNGLPGIDVKTRITAGYRTDDFDWNIASDITGAAEPNILSELTWRDLQMFELKGKTEVVVWDRFVFEGKAGWGEILKGENQDSDFTGNNRTGEFSRSISKTEGHAWDYSFAAGYRIHIENPDPIFYVDDLWMTLLGGYSRHRLQLADFEAIQEIPDLGAFGPPFNGVNKKYNVLFDGPWVGIEFHGVRKRFRGHGRVEWHFPEFVGDATWPFREEFVQPGSFTQTADDGWGLVFDLGSEYYINDTWSLSLNLVFQNWQMENGLDRLYWSNREEKFVDTKLNEVNWQSMSATFGVTAQF